MRCRCGLRPRLHSGELLRTELRGKGLAVWLCGRSGPRFALIAVRTLRTNVWQASSGMWAGSW